MENKRGHVILLCIQVVLASLYGVASTGLLYFAVPSRASHVSTYTSSHDMTCSLPSAKKCPGDGACTHSCCCRSTWDTSFPLGAVFQGGRIGPIQLEASRPSTRLKSASQCPGPFGSSAALLHPKIQPHTFFRESLLPLSLPPQRVGFPPNEIFTVFLDPPGKIPISRA